MQTDIIEINGKRFRLSIPEEKIQKAVTKVAEQLQTDYSNLNPVFVIVLSGAFVFASDLLRKLSFPCTYAFTKIASYNGTSTTGEIKEQLAITENISGRHVVIVEDIVDTGYSMQYLIQRIKEKQPASIEICAFSHKPDKLRVEGLHVKYTGMSLPDEFIVGYGLDYDGKGRELRSIYTIVD